ncbi:MAG: hypothetical protein ABGY08_01750 [Gammaproteobacteria bacterium]|jgi:hypothetical protein
MSVFADEKISVNTATLADVAIYPERSATAIVWGLAFSTGLTLFVVPMLYRLSMGRHTT